MTTHKTTPKVFNDPIHGTVELHPLLVKIIDTPQFQRLRYLKQLGGVYYVYPGATHNRFEHSIGVAHLAGELVKALKTRQPELHIDDRDVLCVQIAGLCHDLGHGPFSHMFEMFIHKARPEKKDWTHEEASLQMFDDMVKKCNLLHEEYEYEDKDKKKTKKKLSDDDLTFIKDMIKGQPSQGRREEKPFLYEIVANKRNGVDVDKFDYLARDAHHLGIKTNFDHLRFIKFARVCEVMQENGLKQKQICTRDKEVNNLYELFHLRYTLHKKAYQHSVSNIIESLIMEAFVKADVHIQIQGSGGKMFTLSTAIEDMEAYTKLTDQVYQQILYSPDPKLTEAQNILKDIVARKHPRFLGERKLTEDMIIGRKGMTPEALEKLTTWLKDELTAEDFEVHDLPVCQDCGLTAEDLEVHIVKFDYGMKNEDPIKKMRFYKKRNPDVARKLPDYQKSEFDPKYFSEQRIRVYHKKTDETSATRAYKHIENCNNQWPDLRDTEGDRSPGGNIQNTE